MCTPVWPPHGTHVICSLSLRWVEPYCNNWWRFSPWKTCTNFSCLIFVLFFFFLLVAAQTFYARSRLGIPRANNMNKQCSSPEENAKRRKLDEQQVKTRKCESHEVGELEIYDPIRWQEFVAVKWCNSNKLQLKERRKERMSSAGGDLVSQKCTTNEKKKKENACKINSSTWSNSEQASYQWSVWIKYSNHLAWEPSERHQKVQHSSKFNYRNVRVIDAGSFQTFIKYVLGPARSGKKKILCMSRMIGSATDIECRRGTVGARNRNQTKSELGRRVTQIAMVCSQPNTKGQSFRWFDRFFVRFFFSSCSPNISWPYKCDKW